MRATAGTQLLIAAIFVFVMARPVHAGDAVVSSTTAPDGRSAPWGIPGPTTAPASDEATANLIKANKALADAVTANPEKLLDFMYPKALRLAGGREKLLQQMRAGEQQDKEDGFSTKSLTLDDPTQIMAVDKMVYAIVPEHLLLGAPGGTLLTKGALLAISEDGGQTWSFVDTAGGENVIRQIISDLPTELKFPGHTKPTFIPDKK